MSVPPELLAALQGAGGGAPAGPAAPDPAAAGLPPEIMQGIEADANGGAGGQPGQGQQQAGDPVDFLRSALDAMSQYQTVHNDDIDLAEAAKIYAQIQKLLAKDQQEREQAMGVTPAHKGMAKAYGAGPAAQ